MGRYKESRKKETGEKGRGRGREELRVTENEGNARGGHCEMMFLKIRVMIMVGQRTTDNGQRINQFFIRNINIY